MAILCTLKRMSNGPAALLLRETLVEDLADPSKFVTIYWELGDVEECIQAMKNKNERNSRIKTHYESCKLRFPGCAVFLKE
ncbi:hypothetical protein CEXT_315681 [Caerostris extrusa]|uniref:Uncharacterized protein n=1 Tax=Caerostris extrusa TaxID=172846 RepID=A0AAV4V6B6_CAEEX|nr:hypothetical protein CEXT_315681 [Caerostris extrusa]